MATAAEQKRDFLAHLRRLNPDFSRSRSSVGPLLEHLDAELAKSPMPPGFAGAGQRDWFDEAVSLCKSGSGSRLARYRPALWCLAKVWGTSEAYRVQGAQVLRVLHVVLVKYDTKARQADSIDARKAVLEDAVKLAAQVTTDYVNPGSRALHGVLMAPEYMFARPSPNPDHQAGDTRHLYEGAKCSIEGWLQKLSARHMSWLLIPGTIAWKKSLDRDRDTYLRRHGRAHRELSAQQLGQRFDAKTQSRGEKALQSLGQFKATFNQADDRQLAMDMTGYDDYRQFLPDTDWWFVTNTPTAKRVHSTRSNKMEYWTKDTSLAREKVLHVAPTNQQKIDALSAGTQTAKRMARNTCVAMFAGRRVLKYHKMADYHEVLDDASKVVYVPGNRSPNCTVDGITFGVEVCLDHAMESTKKLLETGQTARAPDFLALMSAWVTFDPGKLPPGILYGAHCSSKQDLNSVLTTRSEDLVMERDTPGAVVYSLILSP